jgi:hypothetical protein
MLKTFKRGRQATQTHIAQSTVFWVVTSCILVVYRRFEVTYFLHLRVESKPRKQSMKKQVASRMRAYTSTLKMGAVSLPESSVNLYNTTGCHIQADENIAAVINS